MGKKFDYTWLCECGKEGLGATLKEAREGARAHLRTHYDRTPNWYVNIDQYDLIVGELSGKYWRLEKNH